MLLASPTLMVRPETLERIETELRGIRNAGPRVLASAINDTARRARTKVVREIASRSGVKQKTVRQDIDAIPATWTRLAAKLVMVGKRIPLVEFGAKGRIPSRGRPGGVTYRIGRGRAPDAFMAVMRSGHKGAFARVRGEPRRYQGAGSANPFVPLLQVPVGAGNYLVNGRMSHRLFVKNPNRRGRAYVPASSAGRVWRLPIRELKGPSVPVYFQSAPGLMEQTLRDTMDVLDVRVNSKIDWLIGGRLAEAQREASEAGAIL